MMLILVNNSIPWTVAFIREKKTAIVYSKHMRTFCMRKSGFNAFTGNFYWMEHSFCELLLLMYMGQGYVCVI